MCCFPLIKKDFRSDDSFELKTWLLKEWFISMCSGSHQGKSELISLTEGATGLFPQLWTYSRFLPSGGFLRTDIHPEFRGLRAVPSWVYYMIWNRTNQLQRPNRICSCCLKSHSFPSRLLQCWEKLLVRESIFESMRLTQWTQHILPGKIQGHKETSVYPPNSHLHYFYQMFWIWSSNTQRPEFSLTQR